MDILQTPDKHEGAKPTESSSAKLHAEVDSIRHAGGALANKSVVTEIAQSVDNAFNQIPETALVGGGLALGYVAHMPGKIGMIGKGLAAGYALTLGGDVAYSQFSKSAEEKSSASNYILRDSLALGSVAAGLFLRHSITPNSELNAFNGIKPDLFEKSFAHASENQSARSMQNNVVPFSDFLNRLPEGNKTVGERLAAQVTELPVEKGFKMIQEEQIGKFSPETQTQIRGEIDRMTKLGYPERHLMVNDKGTVLLDREAVDLENENEALKHLKK